jgi:hypothetical protein
MWWPRRRPSERVARCRDLAMRRGQVVITLTEDGLIALALPLGEVVVFEPLEVGRLRGRLRDVLWELDGHR